MIQGLLVLVLFLLAGDAIGQLLPLPIPGNVLGMVLLAAALRRRLVPVELVRPAADALLRLLPLFFVPAGVGVMVHGTVLRREWLPIVVASVASTLAVMACVGWLQQRLERP